MDHSVIEQALAAAGFAVLVLDDENRVVDSSLQSANLFGLEPEDLIGNPISPFLPLAPLKELMARQNRAVPPGTMRTITARDKANRELELAVHAVRWDKLDGRQLTTLFILDPRVEMELARATQSRLVQSDNAIRGANIGVFEYDPATETVSVSDIWRQMLEIGPDETHDVQQEWRSRVHPDDLEGALEPIRICLADLSERASCEYRLQSRDRSSWKWLRTDVAVARRDAAGRPNLLVGAQTDISDRKGVEEALRISVEQFRSAFDYAPIGKALVGVDGAFLMVNPALCALLGYSESELLRTNFQALTHEDDLEADLRQLSLLIENKIPYYTMEKRYYRSNGAIMWGRLSVGLVHSAMGNPEHLVSQIVDITDQKRLDQMKSDFVSVVSHELRTPLTSVLGALSLLESYDDTEFPDEVQRLLFIAKTNGDRLHNLINDILDFQKFSARQMRFALSPFAIASLLDEALLANLASADKHGVSFKSAIPDRFMVGLTDGKRFHQVMANLLSNAAKFATAGSQIHVSAEKQGPKIRVCVSNVGEGVPEEFRARVFQPFSQASTSAARTSGGTGLGLSITKEIVEQMGGEIGFDSGQDGKTTFWFTVQTAADKV
jgi:PAS domain S-box-containing protein